MRHVYVLKVSIPPMTTIGEVVGVDTESDEVITFAIDHRPGRELVRWSEAAKADGDPPIIAEVEDWQVLGVHPPDENLTTIIKESKA